MVVQAHCAHNVPTNFPWIIIHYDIGAPVRALTPVRRLSSCGAFAWQEKTKHKGGIDRDALLCCVNAVGARVARWSSARTSEAVTDGVPALRLKAKHVRLDTIG